MDWGKLASGIAGGVGSLMTGGMSTIGGNLMKTFGNQK
jgi:hypothetical protein